MSLIYDLFFLVFVVFYLPVYTLRKKFHRGFRQRLGILNVNLKERPIWVHAVSVGEMKACQQLIEGLRKIYPRKSIAISTVTQTGNKIAKGIAKDNDAVFYLPLDFSFIVRRVVNKINPELFIIAETEIWPNLITCLYKRGIPIVTVNARISDSSFKGYSLIKPLIRPILNKISLFCVQSMTDSDRLISLGVKKEKIKITGNMKYDYAHYEKLDYADYKKTLGLEPGERLFVAGSTHVGEEEVILKAYKELLTGLPKLKLLIAPRHPERAGQIEGLITKFGFNPSLISKLDLPHDINEPRTTNHEPRTVFVLDTIGQLIPFYAIADIIFVGGSLIKKGGHNILEPAFFGKPILVGPYIFNFRDIMSLFIANKAAIMVKNGEELKEKAGSLLKDDREATNLGRRAKELLISNQGVTRANLEFIVATFKEEGDGNRD